MSEETDLLHQSASC